MIYQNPYQNIQTADIYGARKQAAQDQLAAQENQLALQQKQRADIVSRGQLATQALVGFKDLSPQQKAAQWNTYRQRIESLIPETKDELPPVWDSNDPTNDAELDTLIKGWSKTYFKPEQTKLGAEETLLEGTFGVAPKQIARGAGKADTDKLVRIQGVQEGQPVTLTEREFINTEGFKQSGTKIYPDEYPEGVEKKAYYKAFGITPKSKSAVNSLAAPPSEPMAVPGQTELPPRQFNAPSPTNRAGETNVGFPIDENAMLQQPQIMPTMGNSMLRGAGAVMADEFAPQPRNALVGGMMPQPSQFAELMPAGSAPNRLGSPGVEGIDFAATGGQGPVDARGIPLSAIGSARPRYVPPNVGQPQDRFRPATDEQIRSIGLTPGVDAAQYNERTGQVVSIPKGNVEQQKLEEIKRLEAEAGRGLSAAQRDKAKSEATKLRDDVDKIRAAKLSAMQNIVDLEDKIFELVGNEFVDTGMIEQAAKYTPTATGKKLRMLDGAVETAFNSIQTAVRVAGSGDQNAQELVYALGMFPNSGVELQTNIERITSLRDRFMDYNNVQAIVRNEADFNKLPAGTIFYDAKLKKKLRKIKD